MRCFAWIESAVQAFENRNDHDKNGEAHQQDVDRSSIGYTKSSEMTVPQARTIEPGVDVERKYQIEPLNTTMELWEDEKPNRESLQPPVERRGATIITSNNIQIRPSSGPLNPNRISLGKDGLHDSSIALDYNPAVVAYISSGRTQQPKTLKRRGRSSTSTIFLNSPLAPVTIIVTTPDNDSASEAGTPTTDTFNDIRNRRIGASPSPLPLPDLSSSTPQLARTSTESFFTPDTSRLMPPTERQIDTRRLRKAREFRDVRRFLINFLNTKSDQFPKKLRCRMMDLYSITEADLDPAVVKKFAMLDGEGRDEGVALERSGFGDEDGSDAEDLKILAMAFRSQIPVVPSRECTPHGRRASREMIVQAPPTLGLSAIKRRMTGGRRPETVREDEELPPTTSSKSFASNLSVSASSLKVWSNITGEEPTLPTDIRFGSSKKGMFPLHKTMSEPNFHRPSMEGSPLPDLSQNSLVVGRVRNLSLPSSAEVGNVARQMSGVQESNLRLKRFNLITNAVGSLLGAMGGSGKRAEKLKGKEKLRILSEVS